MTSRDIPPDSPCPVCRRAAERLAELEGLVESLSDKLSTAAAHLSRVAERDAGRVAELERLTAALADRCTRQSDLLSKRAEKVKGEG